jgi:hypothetical protein
MNGVWKGLCVALAVILFLGGPLAPVASAQQAGEATHDVDAAGFAAGKSNVFLVAGKLVLCVTSGVLWAATMAVTFGTYYNDAARVVKAGCGGKWAVTPEEMRWVGEPDDPSRRP